MILIITRSGDPHSDIVAAALKSRNVKYARLNTDEPIEDSRVQISFSHHASRMESMTFNNIDLSNIRVIWNRRHSSPVSSSSLAPEDQSFALKEYRRFLSGLLHILHDRFWVNPFHATEAAELKPYQLYVARNAGFDIPETLMTNDDQRALAFFDGCSGKIIYKTFAQTMRRHSDGSTLGIYTTPVQREHLVSRARNINLAPCLFQKHVDKHTELRITAIGTHIFCAEIDTRNSPRARNDWRRYDYANTIYRPYTLHEPLRALVRSLMRSLGLVFGCIDMIVTPDKRFVFLEINPMGEWLWIEKLTGMPMLAYFVEMLIQGTALYNAPSAPLPLLSVIEGV